MEKEYSSYKDLKRNLSSIQDIIYNLIKIGLPASGEQLAMRAGMLVFYKDYSFSRVLYPMQPTSNLY